MEENFHHGTFGILKVNKEVFCWTLEPRDEENATDISSIPAQQYICKRYSSTKYPKTFQIMNVPQRYNVVFHAGNDDDDTQGCILLGESLGKLKGNRAIMNSGATFKKFMDLLEDYNEFLLTIKEVY